MNILQLLPELNVGGVERGTVDLARFLVSKGHGSVVVSAGGPLEEKIISCGARHYTLPVGAKNPFLMYNSYLELRRIIRSENIDIVHARSRVPALLGFFAARAEKRTFLTTAHGQYKKHLASRVMGWGKLVIVAGDVMARHMTDNFGVPRERIVIIPRGVDLEKFAFLGPPDRSRKIFRIGMISRFAPLKGHLDFLKAASYVYRKVPRLEVVLMGDRKSADREYLKKIELATRHLLVDRIVKFVDPDENVPNVLKSLDVFVSANSAQEAFGRSIIEAQARGVPVVATSVGGVVETVENGKTGLLCEPSDPADMADKIMKYYLSPDLARETAVFARATVEKKFSLERMMSLTLEAYEKALALKKILILKMSSFGDIILATPSLMAIRKKFPAARIKILVDARYRKLLEKCPYADEILTCDFRGRDRGFSGLLDLASSLRKEDFDVSIDFQNSRRSHLLSALAAIPDRYGYANGKVSFLLNRRAVPPERAVSPVDHQANVLALIGVTYVEKRLELWPDSSADEAIGEYLSANWLTAGQKLVGLCLAASERWRTKNWKASCFAELGDMLASKNGARIVLIGSGGEKFALDEFYAKAASKPVDMTGKTDIPRLVSLIKRCDCIVTGDSSPMHIAAAVGTPFVAIFGPTDPKRHLGPAQKFKLLRKRTKCSPCYRTTCSKGHECMDSITVREVYQAVTTLLGK